MKIFIFLSTHLPTGPVGLSLAFSGFACVFFGLLLCVDSRKLTFLYWYWIPGADMVPGTWGALSRDCWRRFSGVATADCGVSVISASIFRTAGLDGHGVTFNKEVSLDVYLTLT